MRERRPRSVARRTSNIKHRRPTIAPSPDLARFEQLVLPYLDDAYTLACYLVGDEHAAQDVTQEASLRALRYFASFRDGSARAWFLAIVRNCCHDWRERERGERSELPLSDDLAATVADDTPADAGAIAASERARIGRAVATLSTELREAIVLREVHGLTYEEIARVLGVPIGTVMSRLSRARQRLADVLGRASREVG